MDLLELEFGIITAPKRETPDTPELASEPPSRKIKKEDDLELVDAFDCQICQDLLWKPVTLPCGHNFCCPCFNTLVSDPRANFQCPICRNDMGHNNIVLNIGMDVIIRKAMPEEYEKRVEESDVPADDVRPFPLSTLRGSVPTVGSSSSPLDNKRAIEDIIPRLEVTFNTKGPAPGQELLQHSFSAAPDSSPVDFLSAEKLVRAGQLVVAELDPYTVGTGPNPALRFRITTVYPFTILRMSESANLESRFYMIMYDPERTHSIPVAPKRIAVLIRRGERSYSIFYANPNEPTFTRYDQRRIHITRKMFVRKITLLPPEGPK